MFSSEFGDPEALRILVYEHVSGGGFAGKPLPASVLCEGYAMLRSAVSDFKDAGHTVTITLDSRIAALKPPISADFIVSVSSGNDIKSVLKDASDSADAALVIAPESNGTLQSFIEIVKSTSVLSLNSNPRAIQEATNKAVFFHHARTLGLKTPETILLDACDGAESAKRTIRDKIELPIIVKPVDGVSCSGLSIVKDFSQLAPAMKKASGESSNAHVIAQEFVKGVAASVSLIVADNKALPVSLNKQNIMLKTSQFGSCYEGGVVPFNTSLNTNAFAAAEKAVASYSGLLGHVGVDMVLTEEEPFLLEINPRLTTSIVGLRKVANFNLAQAVLDAAVSHELPVNVKTKGYAFFSKVSLNNPTADAFQRISKMEDATSPPFPSAQNGTTYALIQSFGDSPDEAALKLLEIKKRLRYILKGGKKSW